MQVSTSPISPDSTITPIILSRAQVSSNLKNLTKHGCRLIFVPFNTLFVI